MKDLRQHLTRALDALEFTNAGHLTALNALLERQNHFAPTAGPDRDCVEPDSRTGDAA